MTSVSKTFPVGFSENAKPSGVCADAWGIVWAVPHALCLTGSQIDKPPLPFATACLSRDTKTQRVTWS